MANTKKEDSSQIKFKVEKRDGRIVDFNQERVVTGVFKAADSVGGDDRERAQEVTKKVVEKLTEKYNDRETVKTIEIAEIVKETLVEMGHGKTSIAFELFIQLRNQIKNIKSLIDADSLIRDYIDMEDWRIKENSNMSYSWQGLNFHISSSVQANYWLHSIFSKEISNAHINGDIHLHDLTTLAVYCCGWSIEDILTQGFTGVPGKISCAPPKHFRTALGQIVNFLYTMQHEAAGAQALSSFDTYLAPFIRYDNLDYPQVKQAMQEFIFNMNVPTRVGCQTPFTNITMDLKPHGMLADESIIIGGKPQKETYGEFQEEMDMLNRAFCEVMQKGDAQDRLFTFPIPTYNLTKDFDWDNPKYDQLWEMTAKYGIPYFSNFINSDMSPDDARSMCCRLRLDNRELRKRGGGLFGANPLTGSIGVVTINMARIGYLAKDEKEYFKMLNKWMDIAKEALITRREFIEKYMKKGLYPYSKFYLKDVAKRFGEYFKNHFNTIGLLGLNESIVNFMGKDENITTKKGREFGLRVMDHMREKLMDYQNETDQLFNLEATPGEGTTYRFAKSDKKKFGDNIITAADLGANKSKDPYYTNSSQLPVGYTDDVWEALDLQDDFQTKYTGGTVLHIFLGEKMPTIESTRNFVRKVAENYSLPYFSITPTFSICPTHGYIPGEHEYCPKCDAEVGYQEGMEFVIKD
jgi:ribonucleoside-triphosphate reductase